MPKHRSSDLNGVARGWEPGSIILFFGGLPNLIKPQRLTFNYFGGNPESSFFRLWATEIPPITSDFEGAEFEHLTELTPGTYTHCDCWDFGDFDGEPLPESARAFSRILKGNFLIVQNTSIINRYRLLDGRFEHFSDEQLRQLVGHIISAQCTNGASELLAERNRVKVISPKIFIENNRVLTVNEVAWIQKLIELCENARFEEENLRVEHGLGNGLNPLSAFTFEYGNAARPKEEACKAFLRRLTLEEQRLLEAVYYGGRDFAYRCAPFQNYLAHSSKRSEVDLQLKQREIIANPKSLTDGIRAFSTPLGCISKDAMENYRRLTEESGQMNSDFSTS